MSIDYDSLDEAILPQGTRVWLLRLPDRLSRGEEELLSEEVRARVRSYRNTIEATRFAATHSGAQRVIAEFLNVDPAQVQIARTNCPACGELAHGPPSIVSPETKARISLSRSGVHALVAINRVEPIGVDIEIVDRDFDEGVVEQILSGQELNLMLALTPSARRLATYRFWVRKEAVAKACGVGLALDPRTIDVRPNPNSGAIETCRIGPIGQEWSVHDLELGTGYVGAVAVLVRRGVR